MIFRELNGIKVAVLMGAAGAERQISLQSGKAIASGLAAGGIEVVECDYSGDDESILDDKTIDCFFLAFHGEFGEGGRMQEICEKKKLIFTGSDSAASRLAFDKIASKRLYTEARIVSPRAFFIEKKKDLPAAEKRLAAIDGKFVVKPARQGSSVGISVVSGSTAAVEAAGGCFEQFGDCMIEQFIEGREVTVGILGRQVLPIIEIRTKRQFYDYDAKYVGDATEFLFDTVSEAAMIEKINNAAMKAFNATGCRDFGRVDIIVGADGEAGVIEINTIPGFTSHSLLPKAAAKAGINMTELCLRIVEMALRRKQNTEYSRQNSRFPPWRE